MELTHLAITGVIRTWLIPQKGGEYQAVSLEPATSAPKPSGKKVASCFPARRWLRTRLWESFNSCGSVRCRIFNDLEPSLSVLGKRQNSIDFRGGIAIESPASDKPKFVS